MHIGMLWLDDTSTGDLASKVRAAAAYYRRKYGEAPNLCYVHPSMLAEGNMHVDGVHVYPMDDILPRHLWLGIGEAEVRDALLPAPAVLAPSQRDN